MPRTLDIARIESVTDVENIPSQRDLSGFKREGELRKRFYLEGDCRAEYVYSLLREDWQKVESSWAKA